MLILALDTDRKFLESLGAMLKQALPDVDYRGFTTVSECFDFVRYHDVEIVFFNIGMGSHPYRREVILYELRKIIPRLDFVLVGDDTVLDSSTALWSIQNRCSDYLQKPLTPDKLIRSLSCIWVHKIPKQDLANAERLIWA